MLGKTGNGTSSSLSVELVKKQDFNLQDILSENQSLFPVHIKSKPVAFSTCLVVVLGYCSCLGQLVFLSISQIISTIKLMILSFHWAVAEDLAL